MFFVFIGNYAAAQILINEVCPSNKSTITDQYGETPDWIEIYNSGTEEVTLSNYYISDNEDNLLKFNIPSLTIPSKEFFLIYASDRDEINTEIHTDFKLSSGGEGIYLSNSSGEIMDSISFPSLPIDFSYGREEDGENKWNVFATPTPKLSNNTSPIFVEIDAPKLNFPSGLYDEEIKINLVSNENNYSARYTTDGSIVGNESSLFEELKINKTTNIRIAYFTEDGEKGNEENVIYFYNLNNRLPVIHLSTDPENLYDEENGIFRRGPDAEEEFPFYGANFWKDIEIPVEFTFFENNELQLEYSLGAKIHGGKASRTNPMQSLRLIADNKYGESEMDYPFFKESKITKYKRIVLRNASGDFNYTHFRDGYLARYFAKEKLDLDLLQFRPVVVYINGKYYGLLHIREKIDKHYVKTHYDLENDEYDLLEKDTQIVEGNYELFNEHLDFLLNNDMSIDSNFAIAKSYFDVDHAIDYVAVQSIVNNTDWPRNNIKFWREKDGGKWRYFLFDMDVSMGRYGWTKAERNYLGEWVDTLSNARYYRMLTKFWENDAFSDQFTTRYCDLLNSTFKEENWMAETVQTKETLEPEIKRQFDAWSNGGYNWWTEKGIPQLYEFVEQREDYAREFLRQRFELTEAEKINISVNPPAAGYYEVNTITVNDLPWEGLYFGEIKSTLRAKNNPGFQFSHWEVNGEALSTESFNELTIQDFGDLEIIAHYSGEFFGPNATIYPNPSDGSFDVKLTNNKKAPVEVNIYNTIGDLVYSKFTEELSAGSTLFTVSNLTLIPGIYLLEINLGEFTEAKKLVISN